MPTIQIGDAVRCRRFRGVACRVEGHETEEQIIEPDWDTLVDDDGNPMDADVWWPDEDDVEHVPTGRLIVVMVGDDMRHSVEPEDLTPIDDDEFCGSCGQLGCGWH